MIASHASWPICLSFAWCAGCLALAYCFWHIATHTHTCTCPHEHTHTCAHVHATARRLVRTQMTATGLTVHVGWGYSAVFNTRRCVRWSSRREVRSFSLRYSTLEKLSKNRAEQPQNGCFGFSVPKYLFPNFLYSVFVQSVSNISLHEQSQLRELVLKRW